MIAKSSARRPIRVLIVGPYPRTPDRIDGGVASAVMYLSHALASMPDVELIAVRIASSSDDACETRHYGWPVIDLPLGRLALSTLYLRQKRLFREIIARINPDVVHGQESDIAGHLAVGSGRPTVITVHGILGECARLQSDPATRTRAILAAKLTERSSIRRANDLIAISPYVARYYRNDIRGRVHHIPNPVAAEFFGIDRKPERGRILYAGRISNGKGLLELLQAFAIWRRAESLLVLAGAAPDPAYARLVQQEARRLKLGEQVRFTGLLDEVALRNEFALAQCLVLPSHQETAPMVIQEAMAAGLAVIATKVGGIPEQVEDGSTGFLCNPGDVHDLARALGRLTQDPQRMEQLGRAAKASAEARYRAEAVARSTYRVYQSMVAASASLHFAEA